MSSVVNPLDRGSVAKFQSRAETVFGTLGFDDKRTHPDTSWQLKREQVFRSGKEAEDASSEEEAEEPGQQLVTGFSKTSPACSRFSISNAPSDAIVKIF